MKELEIKKRVSGREHLLQSFDAFLDLYVEEGGDLNKISIVDMMKWCCSRCGNDKSRCSCASCGGICQVE